MFSRMTPAMRAGWVLVAVMMVLTIIVLAIHLRSPDGILTEMLAILVPGWSGAFGMVAWAYKGGKTGEGE
ncbi:MAG: hypothetical protein Kow0026_26000 [Oricola sp.]